MRPSTPLLNPTVAAQGCSLEMAGYADTDADYAESFTEARDVVQQFSANNGSLEAMFTIELSKDSEAILLKAFDNGLAIHTSLTYETADKLQRAISDALDEMEEYAGVNGQVLR